MLKKIAILITITIMIVSFTGCEKEIQLKLSYYQTESNLEILLPASDGELVNFITRLPYNEPVQLFDVGVMGINGDYEDLSYYLNEFESTHICEWNLLAEELEKLDDFQLMSLEYLLEKVNFSDNPSVASMINLTRNTLNENFVFLPFKEEIELFDYYKDCDCLRDMLPSLRNLDDDTIELLDAQVVGEKIKNHQKGSFIGEVYIATDDYLIERYNGNFPKIDVNDHEFYKGAIELDFDA